MALGMRSGGGGGCGKAALCLWVVVAHFACPVRTALPASQKCDEPLVSGLAPSFFISSSFMPSASNSYAPGFAKLNKRGGAGGWCPSDSDHYQWLQVDFGNRKQISAIATQGRYSSSDWVTQYRMLYSDTGRNWKPYHQDGNVWDIFCATFIWTPWHIAIAFTQAEVIVTLEWIIQHSSGHIKYWNAIFTRKWLL